MADVQAFRFEDDGETPNNPHLPLVVYRGAVNLANAPDPATPFERAFAKHGWSGAWRNGIHPFLHFHTVSHEVLSIARGCATVQFGGAEGQVLRGGRRGGPSRGHRPPMHRSERRSSGRRRLSAECVVRPEAARPGRSQAGGERDRGGAAAGDGPRAWARWSAAADVEDHVILSEAADLMPW